MDIEIVSEEVPAGVTVRASVRLSARETNTLFLCGDTLIQLPSEGALPDEAAPIPRPSIFLSELAGSRDGYVRTFADAASARAYAEALRSQLTTALEAP
ncbi:MAG TPA: hypothetical protein PLB30_03565 [Thermoleophilia bacterium]|nr:hypothetical protein [Thermoleophilia bacterium]HQG02770.1 hypothetical protein [Thermoleophilia bacterium]HQJ97616.1 hypothetical protein [Thermoleophilia bacterium]